MIIIIDWAHTIIFVPKYYTSWQVKSVSHLVDFFCSLNFSIFPNHNHHHHHPIKCVNCVLVIFQTEFFFLSFFSFQTFVIWIHRMIFFPHHHQHHLIVVTQTLLLSSECLRGDEVVQKKNQNQTDMMTMAF